ncbi:translocase [Tropicimonas sediminicola]|uniref:Translocase n=1 Tax=Tropicimonas sediminicola TaxID=1031541 RepID=A0A239L3P4_9RHOB|nr:translocase [Tropicimonas sediminicola]SNT24538.1 hypothetical protein SAMN05421757_108217 [Tropicimonas sediminicola]
MQTSRRAVMAGSVFLVALATGYVMQNGDAVAYRFAGGQELSEAPQSMQELQALQLTAARARTDLGIPEEPRLVSLATPAPEAFARAPLPDAGLSELQVEPGMGLSAFGMPCDVTLTASPAPAAMVRLSLRAACNAGEPVTLRHGALTFTEITGTDGHLDLDVPALSARAEFEARLLDGTIVEARAEVPDAGGYERVALQWQGSTGLGLHAFEFGAGYGEPGHVHLGAAHGPDRARVRGAGYLTQLGNDAAPGGWVSEVYSFPAADARSSGAVQITVEAEVTRATCGRELAAQTLQPTAAGTQDVVELSLAVPACDAVGEFLVLDNLVPDVQVAAN